MNIWTLRKKLNQSSNHQTPVESQPARTVQPLPALPPAAPVATPRQTVGLNDLFELHETEIRAVLQQM